jgi:hypothetical protein
MLKEVIAHTLEEEVLSPKATWQAGQAGDLRSRAGGGH